MLGLMSMFVLSALLPLNREAQALPEDNNPAASPEAVVVCGKARFTVLTDRLIRMEYASDGRFEDRASLAVVNRRLPVPRFEVEASGRGVVIRTDSLTLSYSGRGKFGSGNLWVDFRMGGGTKRWTPGLPPEGNLLGTARTLDRFDGSALMDPYDEGVLSRDGWAVLDESGRHLLEDCGDGTEWVRARRRGSGQDLYLFAYGHDYKAALGAFCSISGRVPMPPKYAFGYWWSRFWAYSDKELLALADEFRSREIPIDVMIVDMDWHTADDWTGYTWNPELFPEPERFLSELHSRSLKTSLNLHPSGGVQPFESQYRRFVANYLSKTADYDGPENYIDPSTGARVTVPYRLSQREWAEAYFESIIHPLERQGVDFWWIDWQQYPKSRYIKGLSNTFWLNHVFFRNMEGRGPLRPMIYHRWGGTGSHRYQVGFSGDTYASWEVLREIPYFTATASNVCYGYWGHDIGGHMQPAGVTATDPELYTRWLQSGVFTPIFKTHSTKDASLEKKFWAFPEHYAYMKEAVRLRYMLSPYIYTAARQCYDTGICICRPMYYDYPEEEEAYRFRGQYFFGDDIIAAAVDSSADKVTGLSELCVWLPPGDSWYDAASGVTVGGGIIYTGEYSIAQNPFFIRCGAVIPMASPEIQSLQERSGELWLLVAPGDGESTAAVYEDDGISRGYAGGEYATTSIFKTSDALSLRLRIEGRRGSFDDAPQTRTVTVVLESVPRPVSVGGAVLGTEYDPVKRRLTVKMKESPAAEALELTVLY